MSGKMPLTSPRSIHSSASVCSRSTLSQGDAVLSLSKPPSSLLDRTGTMTTELSMPSTNPSSHFCAGRRHLLSHHTLRPAAVSLWYRASTSDTSEATRYERKQSYSLANAWYVGSRFLCVVRCFHQRLLSMMATIARAAAKAYTKIKRSGFELPCAVVLDVDSSNGVDGGSPSG